jgi:hypothetical protein
MSWNYRVIKERDGTYAIHEVYYSSEKPDDSEIKHMSADPAIPFGDTLEELKEDIKHYVAALDRPVLNECEIKKMWEEQKQ